MTETNDIINNKPTSIWLVDDHQLFRAGFKTLLNRLPSVHVTFEAADGADFLTHLNTEKPDLVFLDISMPNIDGIAATQKALSIDPDLKIVILSMFGEREYYTKLVDLGIRGFLLKSCDFKEVEMAIKAIIDDGEFYFSQELLQQMVYNPSSSKVGQPICDISEREKDVLTEICNGLSSQEISEKLFISKRTVEKHRASLIIKTGCANTAALVVFAVKNGFYSV
ncbi:MAG: response regulator transcription factor [Bacteroidales bacterium]|nr:response regulator transcription factor [Bacteroidales bacterium]